MGSLEETLNKANAELRKNKRKKADSNSDLGQINKSLQEINQSIIGTGETILDLNKTLTRLEDSLNMVVQKLR